MADNIKMAVLLHLLLISPAPLSATITLDGTMGRSGAVKGPAYAITGDLGKQSGSNLFHSFTTFNLVKGEVATFSGPANVTNIISRVTGGSASSIDGTLKSTIAGADLYFLNPAGVMFGANARLDIGGSFHVSTADYLKLGTDGRFDVAAPPNSVLTTAPPSAFGFQASKPGALTITGSLLRTAPGKGLSVVAGDVTLANATLHAVGGTIDILSVASSGEAQMAATGINGESFAQRGKISITETRASASKPQYDYGYGLETVGSLDTSGNGGGAISVRARDIVLSGGTIYNDVYGDVNAGGLVLAADGLLTLANNSVIGSAAIYGAGNGGDTKLSAATMAFNSSRIENYSFSAGNAGAISLAADSIAFKGTYSSSAGVMTSTYGDGNSGDITLTAKNIELNAGSSISGLAGSPGGDVRGKSANITLSADKIAFQGGMITTGTLGSGDAGNIAVTAATLDVAAGGAIEASTRGAGKGGDIAVKVTGAVTIGGGGSLLCQAEEGSKGAAGNIALEAKSLTITGAESGISSSTYAVGNGGSIAIKVADAVAISTGGAILSVAGTGSKGNAGNIMIETGSLNLSGRDSGISSATFSTGNGGSVAIRATGAVVIGAEGVVVSSAQAGSAGNAGNVTVEAGSVSIGGIDAGISSSTFGVGNGGVVAVKADGDISIVNGGRIECLAGVASAGSAGNITLEAKNVLISGSDAGISSSTYAGGNCGSIAVKAAETVAIAMGGTLVCQAEEGSSGAAGNIVVEAKNVTIAGRDAGISSSTYAGGDGGNIVIKASEMTGITDGGAVLSVAGTGSRGNAGNITIETGSLNLAGGDTGVSSATFATGNGGNVAITASGAVTITAGGIVASSAQAGSAGNAGNIALTALNLAISGRDTGISSSTFATGNGGVVLIKTADAVNINGGGRIECLADVTSAGAAGNITIETGVLAISGALSGISSSTYASGNGGSINIKAADAVTITTGGTLLCQAEAGSRGAAGNITLETKKLLVSGSDSSISSATFAAGNGGSVVIKAADSVAITDGGVIGSAAKAGSAGNGGDISIATADLLVSGVKADISSSTAGVGNGGTVSLKASGAVTITAGGAVECQSGSGGTGSAGNIAVETGALSIAGHDSWISSSTNSAGNGGSVAVRADAAVTITDGGRIDCKAGVGSKGNAGSITIASASILIGADAAIGAATGGSGDAGSIVLTAPAVTIAAKGSVSAISDKDATGKGGNISIKADELSLSDGKIIAGSHGSNDGGGVDIIASALTMDNSSAISTESTGSGKAGAIGIAVKNNLLLNDSSITTASASGGGGSIVIDPLLVRLKNSSITTSVKGGAGNGGNIDLSAKQLLLDNSKIVAQADAGNGGNINLDAGLIIQSPTGSLISASSNLGVQGSVVLASPVLDVNAALVEMPSTLRDNASLAPRRCIVSGDEISSFVVYACGASARLPGAAMIAR
jgi:filamentous hemagglutinin family protein